MTQERSVRGRVPAKLKIACKQGGREQQVRSYTLAFPPAAARQLQGTPLGSVDPAASHSYAVHTLIPNLAPRTRLHNQSQPSQKVSEGRTSQQAVGPNLPDGRCARDAEYSFNTLRSSVASAGHSAPWPGDIDPGAVRGAEHCQRDCCCKDVVQEQGSSAEGSELLGQAKEGLVRALREPEGRLSNACEAGAGAAGSQWPAAANSEALPEGSNIIAQDWLESGPHQAARNAVFQEAMRLLRPKLLQPVLVNFLSVAGMHCRNF